MASGVYGLTGMNVHYHVVEVPVDVIDSAHRVLMVEMIAVETARNLNLAIIIAVQVCENI